MIKVFVNSSLNNTHVAVTSYGKVLFKSSEGVYSKKGYPKNMRAFIAGASCGIFIIKQFSKSPCSFFICGPGRGGSFAAKGFFKSGTKVSNLYYIYKKVFNGCRQKKKRRILQGKCLSGLRYQS